MTDFDPDKLKHKPNEKHTLDEVLKSLQDLIHNDLLKGEAQRVEEPAPPELEPEPASTVEEAPTDSAPEETDLPAALPEISLSAADMPLGAVVQSLEELVKHDLALTEDVGETPTASPPPEPVPATPASTTGQQAFAFDEADTPAPAEPEPIPAPPTDEPEPSPSVAGLSDFDELAVELAPPPDTSAGQEEEIATPEAATDDLPVLTDAVPETTAPPIDDLPVLEEIALESPDDPRDGGGRAASGTAAGNNPSAIAARVIARLNADRRARGESEIDDTTLDALYTLLRDEIERHQSER